MWGAAEGGGDGGPVACRLVFTGSESEEGSVRSGFLEGGRGEAELDDGPVEGG